MVSVTGIDVWWLDLSVPPLEGGGLEAALTPEEAEELARFRRPEDRCQRAGARVFLRYVLGRHYLGCPPAEVSWRRDAAGRPALVGPGAGTLDFNLSHAGTHVLVAVSETGRVGVDVEVRVMLEPASLARICAAAAEKWWLAEAVGETEGRERFLRLWTMKEAVLKCHGLGLGCDPRRCEVTPDAGRARLTPDDSTEAWFRVEALSLGAGRFGAVAWPGTETRPVRLRRAPDGWLETVAESTSPAGSRAG